MNLKLAILTTQTTHHAYFVREVAKKFAVARVYCETAALKAPFETAHAFETVREDYERRLWFGGTDCDIASLEPTEAFASINDNEAVASLTKLAPDAVVVFGAGRLTETTLKALPALALNLHGGDPERYRGLDSHLWSIYHSDFSGLTTTLHTLSAELDAGDVVAEGAIPIVRNMKLHEVRAANTQVCVDLTLSALNAAVTLGTVPRRRQQRTGRYYSFMPAVLKDICLRRFEAYTARLPEHQQAAQ